MLRSWLARGVLREAVGGGGSGEGTGGAPAETPPPVPGQPFATFPTQAAFNERMQRATRAELREQFGTDDPVEIKKKLKRAEELEAAETERARLQMTAQQKVEADLAAEKGKREAAEEDAKQARFESHVNKICARLTIPNVDYAMYLVAQEAERAPAGSQVDAEAFLKERLAKPEYKAAFGIAETTSVVPVPVSSSPNTPISPPPPPPANGNGTPGVDVMAMNRSQFQNHLAKLGVG